MSDASQSQLILYQTADGQTRTLTLMVTNAAGQTSSQPCAFIVAPGGKPVGGVPGGKPVGGQTGQSGQTPGGGPQLP